VRVLLGLIFTVVMYIRTPRSAIPRRSELATSLLLATALLLQNAALESLHRYRDLSAVLNVLGLVLILVWLFILFRRGLSQLIRVRRHKARLARLANELLAPSAFSPFRE
jgi:hypothetical protein